MPSPFSPLFSLAPRDHARVHLVVIVISLVVGTLDALLAVRFGDDVSAARDAMRAHGVLLMFLALVPALPGVVGNLALPSRGARSHLPFPRIARAAAQLHALSLLLAVAAMQAEGMRPGWLYFVAYDPEVGGVGVLWLGAALVTSALAASFASLNAVVAARTTAPRSPLAIGLAMGGLAQLVAAPAMLLAVLLVALERALHVGMLDPQLDGHPLLLAHVVWFSVQVALAGALAAAIGVVDERLARAVGRVPDASPPFVLALALVVGGRALAAALDAGVSGDPDGHALAGGAYGTASAGFLLVFVLRWLHTLRAGVITWGAPLIYALAFVVVLAAAGPAALALALPGLGQFLSSTAFFSGALHLTAVGVLLALLSALHAHWHDLTGRDYDEPWARGAALALVGTALVAFVSMLALGARGMPRPIAQAPLDGIGPELMTSGFWLLGVALLLVVGTLLRSLMPSPDTRDPRGA